MSIIRVIKNKNYTMMSNYHLKDKKLSLKAKGLMSYMLSLPDDWDYSIEGLSKTLLEGKGAIATALKELENCRYLIRKQHRNKHGMFDGYDYDLYEYREIENPCTENPITDKPCTENPTQLNSIIINNNTITNIQNTKKLNKESISNDIQKKTANLDDLLTLPDKSVNVDSPLKENTSQDEVKETATDNLDTTDKYNPILFLQKSEGLETPHSTQSPSLAPCGKSREVLDIVSYWKSKEVLSQPRGDVNKWLSGKIRNVKRCNAIEKAIKEYGIENVKIAINRYSIILADDDYYFDTSWGLDIFCKQSNALPDFLDGGNKWESYKKKKSKQIDMFVYPTAKSIEDILDGTHGRENTQQDMSGAVLDSLTEKSVLKSQRRHI